MKKQIKNDNNSKVIAISLEEQNPFDAFTASTMMVIMKKPFSKNEIISSPASPGGGLSVV